MTGNRAGYIVGHAMPTKKPQNESGTVIWRLRVSAELVRKIKDVAESEKRSVTKQAEVMLLHAVEEYLAD